MCVCVCVGGGTLNIIFLVTYARYQQLLFSLKNISGIPRCVPEAFYKVHNLERACGYSLLYGARDEAQWQNGFRAFQRAKLSSQDTPT